MFYGLLIRLFRVLTFRSGPRPEGWPAMNTRGRSRPILHWDRGDDGKPHGHWA